MGIDGDNVRIARFPHWPVQSEEQEANARLISLAPDMLEALRQVVDQWCDPANSNEGACELEMRIRELIQKATGEEGGSL